MEENIIIGRSDPQPPNLGGLVSIPNIITCCNLISGCIATWFAFDIGKELDSLADVITFGFAPSAIVFSFLCSFHIHIIIVPFLAFVMAAFSALRLAKFNLDERQTLGFIGLPTPANALFWGGLITSLNWQSFFEPYQLPTYYIYIVLILLPLSCYLLVSEIPMFALKFKTWGWRGNEVKYIFVLTCIPLLLWLGTLGLAAVIAWYVVLSVAIRIKS